MMTDQTIQASVVAESDASAREEQEFDASWAAFTGQDMLQEAPEETSRNLTEPLDPWDLAAAAKAEGAPAAPPAQEQNAPAKDSEPAPNAAPAADANVDGAQAEVDPALLAAVLMPVQMPASQPAPSTQPQAAAMQAPPQGEEEKPWMPFTQPVQLPPALVQGLFASEDPNQQAQALAGLLQSWGNAQMALMDKRVRDYYQPRFVEQVDTRFAQIQQSQAVAQDFYGMYPDLKAFPQVAVRVAQAMYEQNPDLKYEPKVRDQIAATAREVIKRMGLAAPQAQASAAAPAAQPKSTPAVFDGPARPAAPGLAQGEGFTPSRMVDLIF